MAYTPYDWNQAVQQRTDYIEERLREGSPLFAMSLPEGPLLVTIHQTQRKVYEIYDRIMFGGIGNQSDIELVRNAAIDFAHREGFQRSPDDVTTQRLVGTALSPAVKRGFGDPFTVPFVFRGIFVEMGESPADDQFHLLNYDGEYATHGDYACVAGTPHAENEMTRVVHESRSQATTLESALRLGLEAWGVGRSQSRRAGPDDEEEGEPALETQAVLREELANGVLEAALLDRETAREGKFRLLHEGELDAILAEYR